MFSSQTQAKAVLKLLLDHDPNLVGYIAGEHCLSSGSDQRRAIDDFRKSIASKTNYYSRKHQTKMAELEEKIKQVSANIPKNIPLHQFRILEGKLEEKEVIEQFKTECKRQYLEFTCFCDKLLERLEVLEAQGSETSMDMISQSRRRFGRECNRYQDALPVYAYREYITMTILKNRVTVFIGETGSGKSTQLIQYLYEAGLGRIHQAVLTITT